MKVAVNVSPVQFRKGDFVNTVADALVDSGLPPERLELESTKSALVHNNGENFATLPALKSFGVSSVLDRLGTGYSSLSYLKMFPLKKVKSDRSVVSEVSVWQGCAAIVCAAMNLAPTHNIATTAECVEAREQMRPRVAGYSTIQSLSLARPAPSAARTPREPGSDHG